MGYSREKSAQYLSQADGNVEKAVVGLSTEGGSQGSELNNLIKQ